MYNKILITGSNGFVGTNLCSHLYKLDYNIIGCNSSTCDLRDFNAIKDLIEHIRPDCIIHLAALCGGIVANKENPGKFMRANLQIGLNVINVALESNCVQQFINIGTICAYPKHCPVPFKEHDLWNGYPEETNAPYGIAKKTITELLIAYYNQYGFNSVNLYPTNMYGPFDNFDPKTSHVIPAIILKVYNAMSKGEDRIDLWGTGEATRDFLYVDDFCAAIDLALKCSPGPEPINLGTNAEISIKEIVKTICDLMKFDGELRWDSSLPDGQPRRWIDITRAMSRLKYYPEIDLYQGLKFTIDWFLKSKQNGMI